MSVANSLAVDYPPGKDILRLFPRLPLELRGHREDDIPRDRGSLRINPRLVPEVWTTIRQSAAAQMP